MTTNQPHLRTAAIVRRLGVSAKALRVYEAHGLVTPERTRSGWRVYGPAQIARLHQVLALKSFGFPLVRIAALLSGDLPDLAAFLALHDAMLRGEIARLERALRLISAARDTIVHGASLSSDDLIALAKETIMTHPVDQDLAASYEVIAAKHLSPGERAVLAANAPGGMTAPDTEWDRLHAEASALMAAGDPRSPAAMDLAARWMGKVFVATGGDPELTLKVKAVARETLEQPAFEAASTSSVAMMDFVAQAYGAAIAAGLMPAPHQT